MQISQITEPWERFIVSNKTIHPGLQLAISSVTPATQISQITEPLERFLNDIGLQQAI